MEEFSDKFFHAEKYWNVIKQEDYFESDAAYMQFKAFMHAQCFVYPLAFCTQHNLFMLHFVFGDYKIAVNYHLKKLCKREDYQPSEMQKLPQKLMKLEGWEVWDLSEQDFEAWTLDERIDNVKNWLKEAKQRQIEKGIVPAEATQYV